MKKRTIIIFGRILFWLTWPLLVLFLNVRKSARVLMICKGRVLVVKSWYGDGRWMLPGGGIKRKEKAIIAALRELKEETGIALAVRDVMPLGKVVVRQFPKRIRYELFGTRRVHEPRAKISFNEIIEFAWLELKDITTKNSTLDVLHAKELMQKRPIKSRTAKKLS